MSSTITDLISRSQDEQRLQDLMANTYIGGAPTEPQGWYVPTDRDRLTAMTAPPPKPAEDRSMLRGMIDSVGSGLNYMGEAAMAPVRGFQDVINDILKREGGVANDKADRGGLTNRGITKAALADYRGVPVTNISDADVYAVTPELAAKIYEQNYIKRPGIDRVEAPAIQAHLADASVNHGGTRAVKLLQQTLNKLGFRTAVDGRMGPATLSALNQAVSTKGEDVVNDALVDRRVGFYRAIVRNDPSQGRFLNGWLNRAAEFVSGPRNNNDVTE